MNKLLEKFDVFYNMLLATCVMTNTYTEEAVRDCKKVIKFIGKAYGVSDSYIGKASTVILEDLSPLSASYDAEAFNSSKTHYSDYSALDQAMEIKYEIISMLENQRKSGSIINPGWVDYSYYNIYHPNARYSKLSASSMQGDIISTRQVAIMMALGIGCKKDLVNSTRKLLQCALWGDTVSARLLAYAESLKGGSNQSECFLEYAELMEIYLDDGITELPEEAKEKYSDAACTYYVYTSSIKYDVVYNLRSPMLDFSFLEIMLSKKLGYAEKMTYINEYDKKKWKLFTNDVSDKIKKKSIGF